MASFDFAGLSQAWGGGIQPRLGRARTLESGPSLPETRGEEFDRRWMEEQALASKLASEELAREKERELLERLEEERRQKEAQEYAQWERNQIMNSVADIRYKEMLATNEIGSAGLLAQQAKAAANEAMRRGQGGYAKDFLEIASKYENEATSYQKNFEQLQDQKLTRVRESLLGVSDAASWAVAKADLAQLGIAVPAEARSWGPAASKWAAAEAGKAKSVQAAERLQLQAETAESKAKLAQEKLQHEKEKEQNKNVREALKRELLSTGKTLSGDKGASVLKELRGNEEFADLETSDQLAAANELEGLSRYFLSTGQASNAVEARNMAKQDIFSRISNGSFAAFSGGQRATQPLADASKLTGKDKEAYEWALANKSDPRAQRFLKQFGIE